MNSLVDNWWTVASSLTVQIALVFGLLWVADAVLARFGATRCRAALSWAFFLKLCLPPEVSSPLSVAHVTPALDAANYAVDAPFDRGAWMFALWGIGAGFALLCATRRFLRERRARARVGSAAAPKRVRTLALLSAQALGLRRVPRIVVDPNASGPFVGGLLRGIIVLPARLAIEGTRERLEHVLLHECAHVRRRDPLQSLAWTLVTCVYWFHPCVWASARRAARLREIGCDESASRAARDGVAKYRRTLLDLARPLVSSPSVPGTAFARGEILERLAVLERATWPHPRLVRGAAVFVFVVASVCCVPLGRERSAESSTADIASVQGCLRKRYLVMAEIAKTEPTLWAGNPR